MTLRGYRRDLNAAKKALAGLAKQRQHIDQKMAQLQPVINHLEGLCKELGEKVAHETATKVELTTGLTELARITLKEAFVAVSAGELKKRMEAKGFDFSKYSSPLASVHTVLKRLVKSGQVKVVPQKGGKKTYQWITAIDSLLTVLGTMNSLAQRMESKGSK
jgi:DNA repair exonuclease SbcCD ATPase subunit